MTFVGIGGSTRRQRRRRTIARTARMVVLAALIILVGAVMYRIGLERSQQTLVSLSQAIDDLDRANTQMNDERKVLVKARAVAEARANEIEARYRREVLTGPAKELSVLVNRKLAEGVTPQRLAFVIGAARKERVCDGKAMTKRFMPETVLYSGPNSIVSFAENTITISGDGTSASDAAGKPEAWYDPAKPVTIRFTLIGGESFEVAGKLPLHHSVVLGDAEHRFSMVPGARGFINVIGDKCRYP
ncbi:MAG: hypothetical protein ACE5H8_15930 [Alphaproteobacteria bacterium]